MTVDQILTDVAGLVDDKVLSLYDHVYLLILFLFLTCSIIININGYWHKQAFKVS